MTVLFKERSRGNLGAFWVLARWEIGQAAQQWQDFGRIQTCGPAAIYRDLMGIFFPPLFLPVHWIALISLAQVGLGSLPTPPHLWQAFQWDCKQVGKARTIHLL